MRTWLSFATIVLLSAPSAFAKEPAPSTVGSGQMVHCPTAVPGAKTKITDAPDGVVITVTGNADEIRKRAKHMADSAKADPTTVVHNGEGHGGGGLGLCEVVLKDTTVTAEDIEGGSKITVKPVKAVDLDWLKKETNTRHTAHLSAPKKKPTGPAKASAE
jgi:hypothetical protein